MENIFKIVTKENLSNLKNKYYGNGNELKEGDKIIFGFVNMYVNLKGIPPNSYRTDEVHLAMKNFVLKDKLIYELYNKI